MRRYRISGKNRDTKITRKGRENAKRRGMIKLAGRLGGSMDPAYARPQLTGLQFSNDAFFPLGEGSWATMFLPGGQGDEGLGGVCFSTIVS